jgi:transposase-like protein
VEHSTINRWVVPDRPPLEVAWHRRKRPGWLSWHLDETAIQVNGRRDARAVDKHG